ncbi:hypothetical protein GCM10025865_26770 [Paraoerskovia sediminicola]|uniref:Uncharacterized protein n=1 Tax=Paraoerskovia sediminicola TaxID=1138587 RepID=A0ABN6XEN9_9CELL|nr:hypothetical protein GCM10025865_26770 [Paraoerskovia sediminicola]
MVPSAATLLQENDIVHVLMGVDESEAVERALTRAPKEDD